VRAKTIQFSKASGEDPVQSSLQESLILQVPFTFFPEASGGTEIYVLELARELAIRGYRSAIAAPGQMAADYVHDNVAVYRFPIDPQQDIRHAYGMPDEVAAAGFERLLGKLQPDVVHLHARTAAVSERLVDIGHEAGSRVVLTYHTPTVSCSRGTMLLFGKEPCDGVLEYRRCIACALAAHGAPKALSHILASLPNGLRRAFADSSLRAPFSALRLPGLIADAQDGVRRLLAKVDAVVAVSGWVRDLLLHNGVPAEKVLLSRQGVGGEAFCKTLAPVQRGLDPVTIAYLGRLDPTKGADLLVDAMALEPNIDVRLDFYFVRQPGSEREFKKIEAQARRDRRVFFFPAVPPDRVPQTMAKYDFIAVPSRWLETGPLVVLEAFSAGVPIIGANRGGIAELVQDGVNGLLFEADSPRSLADALKKVATNPTLLEALRDNVRPPRRIAAAVEDMLALYDRLLGTRRSFRTLQ
jgi:glycosyltransferase involved in cell wall biosynthesis